MRRGGMTIVRSDLLMRIDRIADQQGKGTLPALCEQAELIRRDARLYGLDSLALLASALGTMLAAGHPGATIGSLLDLMRDALSCDDDSGMKSGMDAGIVYMAALSSRFGY